MTTKTSLSDRLRIDPLPGTPNHDIVRYYVPMREAADVLDKIRDIATSEGLHPCLKILAVLDDE